jgi:8-oxo-dGTP pyrophosphatase MutT (NUDIX family)
VRQLVIAFCVIEQDGKWHLQLRDGDPKIGCVGLIGGFGGKIEEGEDPLLAICRELSEETSLTPSADEFKKLGIVEVISEYQFQQIPVLAHTYHLFVEPSQIIDAREGELIAFPKAHADNHLDRMTPGTRACFERYILKGLS